MLANAFCEEKTLGDHAHAQLENPPKCVEKDAENRMRGQAEDIKAPDKKYHILGGSIVTGWTEFTTKSRNGFVHSLGECGLAAAFYASFFKSGRNSEEFLIFLEVERSGDACRSVSPDF
jgi:hypothetical protein